MDYGAYNLRNYNQPGNDQQSTVIDSRRRSLSLVYYTDTIEEESLELKQDIVQLQEFSMTGMWNEEYKRLSNEFKSGLHKRLKEIPNQR